MISEVLFYRQVLEFSGAVLFVVIRRKNAHIHTESAINLELL